MKLIAASFIAAAVVGSVAAAPAPQNGGQEQVDITATISGVRFGPSATLANLITITPQQTRITQPGCIVNGDRVINNGGACESLYSGLDNLRQQGTPDSPDAAPTPAQSGGQAAGQDDSQFTATVDGIRFGPSATVGNLITILPQQTRVVTPGCVINQINGGGSYVSSNGRCDELFASLDRLRQQGSASDTASDSNSSATAAPTSSSTSGPSAAVTPTSRPNGAVPVAGGAGHTLFVAAGVVVGAAWLIL